MIILSFSSVLFYSLPHVPTPFLHPSLLLYLSREFLIASCRLYQSDLRLRKPTAPLACSVLACFSTNKLWPTCSFSSRLPFSHQVGTLIAPDLHLFSTFTCPNRQGCFKRCDGVPKVMQNLEILWNFNGLLSLPGFMKHEQNNFKGTIWQMFALKYQQKKKKIRVALVNGVMGSKLSSVSAFAAIKT